MKPLHLLLYINDISDLLKDNVLIFADDVKTIYPHSSLKHSLSCSWTWLIKNQFPLNASKHNHNAVGQSIMPLELNLDPSGTFTSIVIVHFGKDLGI